MLEKTSVFFLVIALFGCSSGPGAPIVRTTVSDEEGNLIPGCQNVAREDKTNVFITDSYLTTWASATREGSAEGLYYGIKKATNEAGWIVGDEELQAFSYGWLPLSDTFCKAYATNRNHIFSLISALMTKLGYDFEAASEANGIVITKYIYGAHSDITWMCPGCTETQTLIRANAKWKDRYIIKIESGKNDLVVVKAFRDVYISRLSEGKWSKYIRATSVGHNEAVILNRIKDALSY